MPRQRAKPPTAEDLRRPRFFFGPGVIIAILLSAVVWVSWGPPGSDHPDGLTPEAVREARRQAPAPAAEGLVPEPTWLRRYAEAVELTADQRAKLDTLIADWQAETGEATAALDTESAALSGVLAQDQERGAANRALLREQAGAYSSLSGQLAEARQATWAAALDLLTLEQRERVRELRRRAPLELR